MTDKEELNEQINRLLKLKKRVFESGAVRDNNLTKPLTVSLKGYTRQRFGYHMRKNASKYGENNWEKGIPTDAYLESIDRHLSSYMEGDRSEDHLSAIIFGIQGCMINEQKDGLLANHYFDQKIKHEQLEINFDAEKEKESNS